MNCPKCGREINVVEGQQYCAHCGGKLTLEFNPELKDPETFAPFSQESPFDQTGSTYKGDEEYASPWEDESATGFLEGLLLTIKQTLLNPADYFIRMPRSGKWWLPVLFYVIMGVIGSIFGLVSGLIAESPIMTHGTLVKHMAISSIMALPVLLFFELYFASTVLYLSMKIFGAGRETFQTTLKIVAYASGPNIFYVVPFVGWLIAGLWSFWITLTGIKVVGQVSTARALLVMIAPTFFLIPIFIGLLLLTIWLVGISSLM